LTRTPFILALVRKSARAIKVSRLALNSGDNDSAVSRAYYSMFDIARAALLRAGLAEDKLPRTHSGVIEAFRRHAVQSGHIDPTLAMQFSRTESLRIKADYTGTEIQAAEATDVVEKAESFVRAVERAFGLEEMALTKELEGQGPKGKDEISEPPGTGRHTVSASAQYEPVSLEEIRRQARENWLKMRQKDQQSARGGDDHTPDIDRRPEQGHGHSVDDETPE
jgi:uncharacterized protein (UPF0332 family)